MVDIPAARAAYAATLALALVSPLSVAAEEAVIEAFSSWEARGQMYPTGPEEVTFVGALSGVIYVKADGAEMDVANLDAGLMSCPAVLTINTTDGSQIGKGKCIILTPDAERVYATFACTGTYLAGCNGEFTLTGGSGEKANISGGGPIQFKSALGQLAQGTPGSIIQQEAAGLAVWPKLAFKLP